MKKEDACMPSRKLLVCFAVLSICGCTKKTADSDNRSSDSELLKLNLQCREAAERYTSASTYTSGIDTVISTVVTTKYSVTYRRCLLHFTKSERFDSKLVGESETLIDPISNEVFAQSFRPINVHGVNYGMPYIRIDRQMTGGSGSDRFMNVEMRAFREFLNSTMKTP
jgi:hypothetical protein